MADIVQQEAEQTNTAQTKTPPPQVQLVQMTLAHWTSRLLHAAVQLGLADHLADGPKTATELGQTTATDAPSLYRLLRTLASFGIFTEDSAHRFALTPLGEALKTGAPGGGRAAVLTLADDQFMPSNEQFLYSLQTGRSCFEKTSGMPLFEWLSHHPAQAALFSETMVGIHGTEPAAIAAAYDFSQYATITDVGGSTGNLLTTILSRHATPRGVLFDLPHTVRDAPALIEARGLTHRISITAGNFFEQIPPGSDAYLLSHIIHDWSEAQCLTILGNCRRAMKPESRLLLIEMVLAAGDAPHPGKLLDMIMLAIPGGQERTEPEYLDLLAKAGFRLTRVVPTQSAASVVEAVAA
jgi:O-methyltransferase domain/Dimerisation domain